MAQQPRILSELIGTIRGALICDGCGKYVGGLAPTRFVPAPYPVALSEIGPDEEAEALIGFESYMAGLLRDGKFIIRHPQIQRRCVSFREWAGRNDDADEGEA